MSVRQIRRSACAALAVILVGGGLGACADGNVRSTGATSSATETGATHGGDEGGSTSEAFVAPNPVHPSWKAEAGSWRVYAVASDDVLYVRQGAGASYPAVAALAPDATGLTVYQPVARVGEGTWQPVAVAGGSGWANTRYLRPEAASPPEVVGTPDDELASAAGEVVAALERADYARLSGLVEPNKGVLISTDAYVSSEDPVLTANEISQASTDTRTRLWGYTDGEGLPIVATIADRLRTVAGVTALTSTRRIGFDRTVQSGNSIDNLEDRFPGTRRVEYNYPGTEQHSQFDWTSVRFVFDTGSGKPQLIAIVQDGWTI